MMNLFDSAGQTDEVCLVYCRSQANLHLQCTNAVLVRLKTNSGHEHIVWMDADNHGMEAYCHAFYVMQSDADDDLSDVLYRVEVRPDKDVFCYNGNTYFLHAADNGNCRIMMLKVYFSQNIVEDIEHQDDLGKNPEAIFLSNFYWLKDNCKKYVLTCWGVVYADQTNYLPVFMEDCRYITENGLSSFMREELPVGAIFEKNGYFYKVSKSADGKLCLERAKSVFLLGKEQNKPQAEPIQARIIKVNFKAKKQGGV